MKKLLIVLLSTLTLQSAFAISRSVAATAPNTSATPSPNGTWLMGENTRGLTVSEATGTAATAGIGFSLFRSETESYRANVAMSVDNSGPGDANFGFSIDFGYRIYRFVSGSLKGFTQPGIMFGKADDGKGFSKDSFLGFYYNFGAEYFFNPNLAIGAMAGLALNMTDGLQTVRMGTSTSAIFLTWYW